MCYRYEVAIHIDGRILREAKKSAAEREMSLSSFVEEALEKKLSSGSGGKIGIPNS
jgi:predicted HicB family RNase H-like nuclease